MLCFQLRGFEELNGVMQTHTHTHVAEQCVCVAVHDGTHWLYYTSVLISFELAGQSLFLFFDNQ